MSATASTTSNNAIVTRRPKRDLETTMNTLKQLLEPAMKKGTRKKNKPRSLAKKVVPPKPASRFENSKDDGEYYPNKLKRKVRLKKTVLRPKHELKVVVATNKRKRGTPHRGIDHCEVLTDWQNIPTTICNSMYTNTQSNNTTGNPSIHNVPPNLSGTSVHTVSTNSNLSVHPNVHRECLNVHTKTPSAHNMYKLISPPHKSLTQLTVDDLIRMDEDSLSGEDMMEILTCPSPVWWEDPADTAQGNVFLTKASDPTPVENPKVRRKEGLGFKRGSVVSATKARKIAKLENVLGHIKSLVTADVKDKGVNNNDYNKMMIKKQVFDDNDVDNDLINTSDENKYIIEAITDRTTPEVNEIDRKRRKISSSGSEISVNEDELLRNLESINIPVEEQNESQKLDDKNKNKNYCDLIDDIEEENETEATTKESQDSKNLSKGKQDGNNDDSNNKEEINKPPVADKSILKKLKNKNDDILDVRVIKVPTNVTNEVKVWSKLENFKRHNFKPSDFERNKTGDEYEIPISRNKIREQDPLELNETILIDDDSNDCNVDTGIDVVSISLIENTHVTKTPTDNYQSEVIEIDSVLKDTIHNEESDKQEMSDKTDERSIIKEDTIRIGNDLDVRLIITSNLKNKQTDLEETNVKVKEKGFLAKIAEKEESIEHADHKYEAKTDWHVHKYLKFDNKTNDRGIFRVEDPDDSTDTILCLNDVDVSLVKNPRSHDDKVNTLKVDESMNDLSITLISKSENLALPNLTKHSIVESPISIKSLTSESTENDTISDTNIQFLDEYDDKLHRKEDIADSIDLENEMAKEKDLELDEEELVCLTNADIKIQENGDDSTDYED